MDREPVGFESELVCKLPPPDEGVRTTLWGLAGKPFADCCAAATDEVGPVVASVPCPPEERLDAGGWDCVDGGVDVSGGTGVRAAGGAGLGAELAAVFETAGGISGSQSDFCSSSLL